jgi:hypothetical protein
MRQHLGRRPLRAQRGNGGKETHKLSHRGTLRTVLGRVNRPAMTTLPGFMAGVWRRPLEPPPMAQPNGLRAFFMRPPRKDGTVGCVALTDAEIREIGSLVPTGARIVIHP